MNPFKKTLNIDKLKFTKTERECDMKGLLIIKENRQASESLFNSADMAELMEDFTKNCSSVESAAALLGHGNRKTNCILK